MPPRSPRGCLSLLLHLTNLLPSLAPPASPIPLASLPKVHPVPAAFVRAQIDAVLGDMGAHAVKTGMLPSEEAIATVAEACATSTAPLRRSPP